ncbi:MAG TPA: di-heme oxidoredictase family protein [Thermoanaerobaculia bacterium]|nr:di-heme oxidoredictase family protein [Thermoanaerobaculia bacterium]
MSRATKWIRRLVIPVGIVAALSSVPLINAITATEAPAGFDNLTNGFTSQATFDLDREVFEGREDIGDGLGPLYNAQACAECHQTPVTGGTSQITELRVGRFDGFTFTDRPGGSLINDRAIDASIQERVAGEDNVADFRSSLNILGDGFVEAIADATFTTIRNSQPSGMKGQIINVPVGEAPGQTRVARFGWKNQHASLLSFSADAYLNEMGITSPLQPAENTSNGVSVAAFDTVPDPEEPPSAGFPFGEDVELFARFMRATKAPSRDAVAAATPDAITGSNLFTSIGCANCHRTSITTAPTGTIVNGGKFTIPPALGDKIIHPYSDFMLHDVGTGDFIVQNGGQSTLTKLRTPPLWGLRTRSRMMHDTISFTRNNAILAHFGEANPVINNYINLSLTQKNQLIAFLNSL